MNENDDLHADVQSDGDNSSIAQLRDRSNKAEARAQAAEQQAQALQSQLLMFTARDAGFDTSNPAHRRLLETYDGETTPEAVQKFAQDMGVQQQPAVTESADQFTGVGIPEPALPDLSGLAGAMDAMAGGGDAGQPQDLATKLRVMGDAGASQEEILAALPQEWIQYSSG